MRAALVGRSAGRGRSGCGTGGGGAATCGEEAEEDKVLVGVAGDVVGCVSGMSGVWDGVGDGASFGWESRAEAVKGYLWMRDGMDLGRYDGEQRWERWSS